MTRSIRDETDIQGCRTTRIYCRFDCPAGKRMKSENRVYFSSREEARASGYRACKVCKPNGTAVDSETFFVSSYKSPLGTYTLVSSRRGVVLVDPEERAEAHLTRWRRDGIQLRENGKQITALARELDSYFARKLRQFTVPLDLRGTAFQLKVWEILCSIPYGIIRSYGEVAQAIGKPRAARGVGQAVGRNPVSIVVPCHRVIGSDGTLTGYGGGLHRKRALLELESAVLSNVSV